MSVNISQKSIQDQFIKLTDTEKDQYIKTHWIHKDGHISTKHFMGKLLNKWVVTRGLFRKMCGISLPGTIQKLEKSRGNLSEKTKQLEFNATCDFLITLIQKMHTKKSVAYQQSIIKLKFTLFSLSLEQTAKVVEKVKELKDGEDIQVMRQKVNQILAEYPPELKEALITAIFKHVDSAVASQLFHGDFLANSAAEKAVKVAGIAQNSEALKKVLADETLHAEVAQGIAQIKQHNAAEAASIIQQIKQALPSETFPQGPLAALLKPEISSSSLPQDEVDSIIKKVKNLKSSDTFTEIADKVIEIQGKFSPDKKEAVISEILKHVEPDIAVQIFNMPCGNAAKVLGLIENPAALKKVCLGKNTHDSLADGLEQIRLVDVKQGDLVAEALARGFASVENLPTRLQTDLKSRADEGINFAKTWQNASKNLALKVKALSNDKQALTQLMKELQNAPPGDHYSYIQAVVKNVNPALLPYVLTENFTDDAETELIVKLEALSELDDFSFFSQVDEDEQHERIAAALQKLAGLNRPAAVKVASLLNADPAKLHLPLYTICRELSPFAGEPFAQIFKQLNQTDGETIIKALNDSLDKVPNNYYDKRLLVAQALSVVAPEHAVYLFTHLPPGPLFGYALLALQENPAAFEAILQDPKTHQRLYIELWDIHGFRAPLIPTLVNDLCLRMEKLNVLKGFISKPNLNLGPLVEDLPITTQKKLLDHLKDETSLPKVAAAIVHNHSVPEWEHAETWRIQGPYVIEDFYYRPVTKEQLPAALFEDPKTKQALEALTKPQDAVDFIIEFASLLNDRFNPSFQHVDDIGDSGNEYAPGTEWYAQKQKLLNQLMDKKQFLSEEYSSVIKEEYKEGLEIVTSHLLELIKRLPGDMPSHSAEIIQGIKKYDGIAANIYLLLLVLKLDPKEQAFMAQACHDHEFAYLLFQMDSASRDKMLKDRLDILKKSSYRLKEFKEIYMAFIPVASVAEHKRVGSLIDSYISKAS